MFLNRRIDNLERWTEPNESGFRPCARCEDGEKRSIVIRTDGVPEMPETACPSCGRTVVTVVNFIYAKSVNDQRKKPPLAERLDVLPTAATAARSQMP